MPADAEFSARVREVLAVRNDVTEMRMMGSLCFMVGGHMACCVRGKGGLMVRVGPDGMTAALAEPHVRPVEYSQGRRLGGFVIVAAEGVAEDAALAAWIARGVAFVTALPPKVKRKKKKGVLF